MAENKDDRTTDNGTAGPRPQGVVQGALVGELEARAKFLRDVKTKVVVAPEQKKPAVAPGANPAQTK